MHRAKHAYDNSYDNPENVREALAYCGEQREHVLSVRSTEKDGKRQAMHTLSIGTPSFFVAFPKNAKRLEAC